MCIPPSDPSYAEALTFCGTMVETLYPTGLSPPSDLLSSITDPIDLFGLSYPGYRELTFIRVFFSSVCARMCTLIPQG